MAERIICASCFKDVQSVEALAKELGLPIEMVENAMMDVASIPETELEEKFFVFDED